MNYGKRFSASEGVLALSIICALYGSQIEVTASPRVIRDGIRQIQNQQPLLAPEERDWLSTKALNHLRRNPSTKNDRLRVLSVKRFSANGGTVKTPIASIVIFNYSRGSATRLTMDSSNGVVLRQERLRGRPQSSEEERREARLLIWANPQHAQMLRAGAIIEGGFVVDGPGRESWRHRFLLFQLLSSDRQSLQRVVIVNLTTRRIAQTRPGISSHVSRR